MDAKINKQQQQNYNNSIKAKANPMHLSFILPWQFETKTPSDTEKHQTFVQF